MMRLDNRIPNAATCRSLELGMIRCLDEIAEQVRRALGLSMTAAQIESVLRGEAGSVGEQAKEIIQREAWGIRTVVREELHSVEFVSAKEKNVQPQAGDVDDNVLGFLLALQNDGGDE